MCIRDRCQEVWIHRHLFQDVYEWAGHSRDEPVKLADGAVASEPLLRKVDGGAFLDGAAVAQALDQVAKTIRNTNYLRGLPREQFAARAADTVSYTHLDVYKRQ